VVAESFVLRINISGKNPAHRKSANRWHQALKDNGHENIHHQQFRYLTTMWHIYFLQNKQPAKNKRATV